MQKTAVKGLMMLMLSRLKVSRSLFKFSKKNFFFLLAHLPLCLLLSACGGDNEFKELQAFMDGVKARQPAPVEPAPEFKQPPTFIYPEEARRDPFKPEQRRLVNNGIRPELDRQKEPLETYPLDALRMVGSISRDSQIWAMILTPDKGLMRVTTGGYIGQNYGRVNQISNREILITETIPDGDSWRHRPASLLLNDE